MSSLFDSSSLEIKQINNEEFRSQLISKLQNILLREFNEPQKLKVKNLKDSINFACPYCRDSLHDTTKKRAHLILKGKYANLFKCFNCGKCTSITKFFEDFSEELPLDSIEYINLHPTDLSGNGSVSSETISLLLDKSQYLELSFSRDFIKSVWKVFEIDSPEAATARNYLNKRLQYNYNNFLYSPTTQSLLILNQIDDRIIGIQIRDLSGKKKAKYLTFGLKKLHDVFKTGKDIPEEMNTMSMLFNLFQVDITRPVIVLEGPMDSFFIKNAIASCGAFKNIKLDIDFWYLYDSDKAGIQESLEKLQSGFHVFMWKNLIQDLMLPPKKKWDVNDVMIFCKDKNLKYPNWMKYFSNDSMDILNI